MAVSRRGGWLDGRGAGRYLNGRGAGRPVNAGEQ